MKNSSEAEDQIERVSSTIEPAIEVENVYFSYNGLPALDNVSFRVENRELVTIVGPNGGGKTTLLKLLLGLLEPSAGTIRVLGDRPLNVRHRIGYMPQNVGFDLKFPVSVLDVVLMGRLGRHQLGHYNKQDRTRALESLAQVELVDRADSLLSSLSGGQRQRVFLARALAGEPDMLFLDEPTANVDIAMGAKLFDFIHRLSQDLTIIVVSHDLGMVSRHVRKVLCVSRQVYLHPTTEISDDTVRELYGCEMRLVRHDHRHDDSHDESPADKNKAE